MTFVLSASWVYTWIFFLSTLEQWLLFPITVQGHFVVANSSFDFRWLFYIWMEYYKWTLEIFSFA